MNKKQFKECYLSIDYAEYKNSTPEVADIFSISSYSYALYGGYYNFKIETPSQKAYFGMYDSNMCDSNEIWDFLEELCDDDFKITSWFIDLEGYGPDIIAEDVGNGNIRLTITNYKWEEFYYDKDLDIVNIEKKTFPDYENHIQLDIIVNKKKFIYHFYLELLYIFDKEVYKGRLDDILLYCYEDRKAKIDSEKIAKYLGFTEANELDRKLYRLLGGRENGMSNDDIQYGTPEEIEECLKEGANPNAIIIDDCNDKTPVFNLALDSYYPNRLFYYRLYKETNYDKYKRVSKREEIKEKFKKEHFKEIEKIQRDIIDLFLKYGARTYYLFPIASEISENILESLFENGCKITSNSRKDFLQENRSLIDLFNKYKCFSSYRWIA